MGANQKLLHDLYIAQNRILRTCLYEDGIANINLLHQCCNLSKLYERRLLYLNLFMYKQQANVQIVDTRHARTRAHNALLFKTEKPNNEKLIANNGYSPV